MHLDAVKNHCTTDLAAVERKITESTQSDLSTLNNITQHLQKNSGKRLRACLVILSAKSCLYKGSQHIDLACIIEMIHAATLLHDDVIDNSSLRHQHTTIHNIWGNTLSILSGDFLYAAAFQMMATLDHPEILSLLATSCSKIVQGEIKQYTHCHNPLTTLEDYFAIIDAKTATLFSLAAQTGSLLAQPTKNQQADLKQFGKHLGIAFQLIDDTLDYHGSTAKIGKNIGDDLAEGKPTYPILWALQHASASQHTTLSHAIKNGSSDIESILPILHTTGAIEQTIQQAQHHAEIAHKHLASLPQSPHKQYLYQLIEFALTRDH